MQQEPFYALTQQSWPCMFSKTQTMQVRIQVCCLCFPSVQQLQQGKLIWLGVNTSERCWRTAFKLLNTKLTDILQGTALRILHTSISLNSCDYSCTVAHPHYHKACVYQKEKNQTVSYPVLTNKCMFQIKNYYTLEEVY